MWCGEYEVSLTKPRCPEHVGEKGILQERRRAQASPWGALAGPRFILPPCEQPLHLRLGS